MLNGSQVSPGIAFSAAPTLRPFKANITYALLKTVQKIQILQVVLIVFITAMAWRKEMSPYGTADLSSRVLHKQTLSTPRRLQPKEMRGKKHSSSQFSDEELSYKVIYHMLHKGGETLSMCYLTVHQGAFISWCSVILCFLEVPRKQISLPLQEQNSSCSTREPTPIRHRASQHSNASGQLALNDLKSHKKVRDFLTLYPQHCYGFCAIS